MYKYLYQYLILNKELSLPGVGSFNIDKQKANLNFIEKEITLSRHVVHYAKETFPNDNNFFPFLSRNMQTDEANVLGMYSEFTATINNELTEKGSLILPGIGTIIKKSGNENSFTPQVSGSIFFTVINAERVIRKNSEHKVTVGDAEKNSTQMQNSLNKQVAATKWWIPAAVLAVIGIVALIFYYAMHGALI